MEIVCFFLLTCRTLLSFSVNSTLLAIIITACLLLNYCFHLSMELKFRTKDLILFVLLILSVPFRNFILVFDIFLACRLLEYEKIDRILFYKFFFEVFMIILIFLFIELGKYKDELVLYDKRNSVIHTLGFPNSNSAALFFFQFNITLLMLWNKYKSSIFLLMAFFVDYIIYRLCYGRTYHYAFLLIVLLFFLCRVKIIKNYVSKLGKYLGAILIIISFLFPIIVFGMSKFIILNKFFSGRLFFFYELIQQINIKNIIFGMKYTGKAPLDSSYIQLFLSGGICFIIYFIRRFFITFKVNKGKVLHNDLPLLVGISFAGLTESFIVGLTMTSVLYWYMLVQKEDVL